MIEYNFYPDKTIQICHQRSFTDYDLVKGTADVLPPPKKHQHCMLDLTLFNSTSDDARVSKVLDVLSQRRDINTIKFKVARMHEFEGWFPRLGELLDRKDRTWTIELDCEKVYPKGFQKVAPMFRVFRKVSFLVLTECAYRLLAMEVFQDLLVHLQELRHLNIPTLDLDHLEALSQYPGASKWNFCFRMYSYFEKLHPFHQSFVLSPTVQQRVCSVRIVCECYTVYRHFLMALPSLQTLSVSFDQDYGELQHESEWACLCEWLASPLCPIQNLMLDLYRPVSWQRILELLPQDVKCKVTVCLYIYQDRRISYMDALLQAFSQTPAVDSFVLMSQNAIQVQDCQKILQHQVSSRPRMISVQMHHCEPYKKYSCDDHPEYYVEAEKINHVSFVFQTYQRFQRCCVVKQEDSDGTNDQCLPLAVWSRVLDKLASAYNNNYDDDDDDDDDCPADRNVHAVSCDASFQVLQELLGETWRWVDPMGLHG